MLDDELRALVSVEPCQDFRARVQTAISAHPARARWMGLPALSAAAAGLVAMVVALAYSVAARPDKSHSQPAITAASALPVAVLAPSVENRAPSAVFAREALAHGPRPGRPTARPGSQLDEAEAAGLQRLFGTRVPLGVELVAPHATAPGAPEAIEIPPLSIPELKVDLPLAGDSQ